MIIISMKKDYLIDSNKCLYMNISSTGNTIFAETIDTSKTIVLAKYSTKEKTKRAFGQLINAFKRDEYFYEMLSDDDPILNTQTNQGQVMKRYNKMSGKTK